MHRKPHDLSEKYWNSLTQANQEIYLRIRPLPKATYTSNVHLSAVERFLKSTREDMESMGGKLDLNPDFQRDHVWTKEQRQRYIESLFRGVAPDRILFNCPGWTGNDPSGDLPKHTFECIDGLQRLTAMRGFLAGEFTVFDGLAMADLKGTPFHGRSIAITIVVFEFNTRADLLQFYLDLNSGGTVHSAAELDRVRELHRRATQAA